MSKDERPLSASGETPVTDAPARSLARRHAIWSRIAIGLLLVTGTTLGGAWLLHNSIDSGIDALEERSSEQRERLATVKSWAYRLQGLDVAAASGTGADLIVVDEEMDATPQGPLRAAHVRQLQRKPDGDRRLVLAYLSIGEAEDYRPYWNKAWPRAHGAGSARAPAQPAADIVFNIVGNPANAAPTRAVAVGAEGDSGAAPTVQPPAWLGDQIPKWRGNYRVRFWDPAWQAHLFGSGGAALERIVAAGFDGVYLDRADVYTHWLRERPSARDDMVRLIERLSERARASSPGFLVVMQNAEELLGQHRVRRALDGVAKEDLLYGVDDAEQSKAETEIAASVKYLRKARKDGLPVLVVEYVADKAKAQEARKRIEALGFVPSFAPRALDRLSAKD